MHAKPPEQRRNRTKPQTEFVPAAGVGWQHGPIPDPPPDLQPASVEAWNVWMSAWFAAFWTPADLPGLRQVVLLYDECEQGKLNRHAELRISMDSFGMTPKGQAERRWMRPDGTIDSAPVTAPPKGQKYGHLRDVSA